MHDMNTPLIPPLPNWSTRYTPSLPRTTLQGKGRYLSPPNRISGATSGPLAASTPGVASVPSAVPSVPAVSSSPGVVTRVTHRRRLTREGPTSGNRPLGRGTRRTPTAVAVPSEACGAGRARKITATPTSPAATASAEATAVTGSQPRLTLRSSRSRYGCSFGAVVSAADLSSYRCRCCCYRVNSTSRCEENGNNFSA